MVNKNTKLPINDLMLIQIFIIYYTLQITNVSTVTQLSFTILKIKIIRILPG